MSLSTATQHRLYLKQIELLKNPAFNELLRFNFNYQDMIIVSSGMVDDNGQLFVFQTYSCGCGPTPLIRSAFLLAELAWEESEFRRMLAASDDPKDVALVDQDIFTQVQRIRRAYTEDEKIFVTKVLQRYFNDKRKINFF